MFIFSASYYIQTKVVFYNYTSTPLFFRFVFKVLWLLLASALCYIICSNIFMQFDQPPHLQNNQKISLTTQSRLIDTFQYHQVPQFYQNIFINHIKNQQAMEAELCMREEIQSLSNNSSYIQSFLKYCAQKEKYEGYVRVVMNYKKDSYESEGAKLIKICELASHLRDVNYRCAYFLLKIRGKYEQNVDISQSSQKYYYNSFAMKLDSFRKELLKTEVSKYIEFQPEYDPFFMNLKLKQFHSDRKCQEAIQMLMQFTVENSYKYLKMSKILMDWIYMHSRKKMADNNLYRIDLPKLGQSQQYVEYDKLKEEVLREKLRDKVNRHSRQINRNRGILDIYNDELDNVRIRNMDYGEENEIVSIERYEKQQLRRERQQQRKNYLNEDLFKLLDKNMASSQKPTRNYLRIKSESSSYDTDYSMIGKIRRFKISNNRTIPNSPNGYQSKRSETLPILPREERQNQAYASGYHRNAETRAIVSPKEEYNRKYDYKEQRYKKLSRDRIKLSKIDAYQITIGKDSNNQKYGKQIQKTPTVRKEPTRNETSNQPFYSEKAIDKTITKQPQTKRYEQRQQMIQNKGQNVSNSKESGPQKNQSLKKKTTVEQNQASKRTSIPEKSSVNPRQSAEDDRKRANTNEQTLDKTTKPIQQNTYSTKTKEPEPNQMTTIQNQTQKPFETKPISKKQQNKIKIEPELEQNQKKQERRQIKMRVGKYTLQNFSQYFNNYQIHKDYLKLYDKDKISKELQFQQTYIIQFLINGEPGALAIIYLIPNSKLVLRLWVLEQKQEATLSYPLLKKIIEYVQKSTTNQFLYYKGSQFPELSKAGFIKKKEDLFERKRTIDPKEVDLQFQQCFSMQSSQIKFLQKQKEDILVSAEIQNFTVENSIMAQCLTAINEEALPQKLRDLIVLEHNIQDFKALNKLLQKQDLDLYQANSKIAVKNIDVSYFNFLSDFRDSFAVSEGFVKFYGIAVRQTQKQTICSIKLSKNNGKLYFCKGYKSAHQVQKDLKAQSQNKVQFWVPMFNKKLYGRYKNYKSSANELCYANWDISISWQDEMQGALRYNKKVGVTFQQCAFYVCIEIQGSLLYTFEVNQDDYIF